MAALLAVISLQIVVLYSPFMQNILGTTNLSVFDWLLAGVIASSIIISEEARKYIVRRWNKEPALN